MRNALIGLLALLILGCMPPDPGPGPEPGPQPSSGSAAVYMEKMRSNLKVAYERLSVMEFSNLKEAQEAHKKFTKAAHEDARNQAFKDEVLIDDLQALQEAWRRSLNGL